MPVERYQVDSEVYVVDHENSDVFFYHNNQLNCLSRSQEDYDNFIDWLNARGVMGEIVDIALDDVDRSEAAADSLLRAAIGAPPPDMVS